MDVSVGRVVHFVYDESSAMQANQLGGNQVRAGHIEPAIIVRTWGGTTVQLKVFRDGPKDLWVTSVQEEPKQGLQAFSAGQLGDEDPGWTQRTWHWPPRV